MDRCSSPLKRVSTVSLSLSNSVHSGQCKVTEKDIIYFHLLCENLIIYDRLSTANYRLLKKRRRKTGVCTADSQVKGKLSELICNTITLVIKKEKKLLQRSLFIAAAHPCYP